MRISPDAVVLCKLTFRWHWAPAVAVLFLASLAGCAHSPLSDSQAVPGATLAAAPLAVTATAGNLALESAPHCDFTLVAGGDVTPAHHLKPWLRKYGPDYPYQLIAPYFQAADIGLVNLECPLSAAARMLPGKKFTFCGEPCAAQALRRAGITVVSLANNHILDCGSQGLADTLSALQEAQVAFAGAGTHLAASRKAVQMPLASGASLGVLAYSLTFPESFYATPTKPGTAPGLEAYIVQDIAQARAWADIVVVYFHWGGELVCIPRAYQETLAHAAIRAGARLVLGAHPHVLQGIEWYQNGLIFYSLGNLAFGGGISRQAKESVLAKVIFRSDGSIKTAWILPLSVDNAATHFIPMPLKGSAALEVCRQVQKLSAAWGTVIENPSGEWGRILPPGAAKLAVSANP